MTATVVKVTQFVKTVEGIDIWYDVVRLLWGNEKIYYIEVPAGHLSIDQVIEVVPTSLDDNGVPRTLRLAS